MCRGIFRFVLLLSFFNVYIFFSFFNVCIYLLALFVQMPFSSLSCAGSSWLPLPLLFSHSFSLLPTPNRPCLSEHMGSKVHHKADSFEPAEWSELLTPGQSGWLGAAALGSIPTLALWDSFFNVLILSKLKWLELVLRPLYYRVMTKNWDKVHLSKMAC